MTKVISIPRINALGLKGSDKSSSLILDNIKHKKIDTTNEDISKDERLIYNSIKKELTIKNQLLLIGGDHSITYSLVRAASLQGDLGLITVKPFLLKIV